jgi:hypothetical protein
MFHRTLSEDADAAFNDNFDNLSHIAFLCPLGIGSHRKYHHDHRDPNEDHVLATTDRETKQASKYESTINIEIIQR